MANGPSIRVKESDVTPLLNENQNSGTGNKIILFIGALLLLGLLGVNMQPSQRQQGGVSVQKHISSGIDPPSNSDCVGWNPFLTVQQSKQYTYCNKQSHPLKTQFFSPVMTPSHRWVFRGTFRAPISLGHKGEISIAKFKFTPTDSSNKKPKTLEIKYTPEEGKVVMNDYFKPFGGADASQVDQIFGATQSSPAYWTVTLRHDGTGKHQLRIEFAGDGISPTSRFGTVKQSQTAVMPGKFELVSLDDSVVCAGVSTPTPGLGTQFTECGATTLGTEMKKVSAKKDVVKKPAEAKKEDHKKKEVQKEEKKKVVLAADASPPAAAREKKSVKAKSDQAATTNAVKNSKKKHD